MAFGGDTSQWADTFPDSLIPDVLQLILDGWERMPPAPSEAKEEATTRQLREILRQSRDLRGLPFSIWPESTETDPSCGREIGRIDLRFVHGYREEVHLAFECKRLYYAKSDGTRVANTSEYTGDDGMMCFVTGKYSRGLPHGGMIGYVLDGNVTKAKTAINKSIRKNSARLKLTSDPPLCASLYFPKENRIAESKHDIRSRTVTIFHVLLAN